MLKRSFFVSAAFVVLVLGCSSSSTPGGDAGVLFDAGVDAGIGGSLTVQVSPPTGATVAVTVTGPGGYSSVLTGTQTLSGLAPGSYSVSAARVIVPGTIVSTVWDPSITGSPAAVAQAATATVSVGFGHRPGSGKVWISDKVANAAYAFTPDQLASSGNPDPAVGIGLKASSQAYSPVFDAQGDLWIALPSASKIVRFAPALIAASGAPTETASIHDSDGPFKLAFDAAGDLWVSESTKLSKYKAADLSASGVLAVSPALTLTPTGATTLNALAFDSAGNLWVADDNFTSPPYSGVLRRFSPAQLAQTGNVSLSPDATYNNPGIATPQALAFDAAGNLWAANFGTTGSDPSVIRIDASQLAGTGAVGSAPSFTFTSASLSSPGALAFDESGNLWIENHGNNSLVRFLASQLVATGSATLTPSVTVSGAGSNGYSGLAFDPPPANLNLPR